MIASLLATDPRKSDTLGKEITRDLYAIFRREREEGRPARTQGRRCRGPAAALLRCRFDSRPRDFRSHVVAALKGVAELDDQTRKDGKAAEERFVASYPFHPDLIEVFYSEMD